MKEWSNDTRLLFERDGYVILKDILSGDECAYISDVVCQISAWEKETGTAHFYDDDPSYLSGLDNKTGKMQRIWNLINKHEVFRELIQKRIINEVMEDLFDRETKHLKYVLSSFQANIIGGGSRSQKLHVDIPVPEPLPPWIIKANTIWLLDDFTENNGATVCLPGSHKFQYKPQDKDQNRSDLIKIKSTRGSVIITHGGLWHKSGNNETKHDRIVLLGSFSASYIREISNEESHLAIIKKEVFDTCSKQLQEILGFQHGIRRGALQPPPIFKKYRRC